MKKLTAIIAVIALICCLVGAVNATETARKSPLIF